MVEDKQAQVPTSNARDWISVVANSPFAHVLAGAEIGLFQVDMATGRATWDKVTSKIFGLGAIAQLRPTRMPIHADDLADVARRLDRISKGGGKKDMDLRIVRGSGEVRWTRSTVRLAPGQQSRGRHLLGLLTDVTERHRDSVKLAEADHSVSDLLDSLPHMIWSTDSAGKTNFLSSQWTEFTGRDLRGDLGQGWAAALHPEDRDEALSKWLECVRTISSFDAEFRIRSRSGEYHWFVIRGLPVFSASGELSCWRGTCTDVHDRVLAHQALDDSERLSRAIIEASPDCMSLLDAEGIVIFVNQAVLTAYQVQDSSELLGRQWKSNFGKKLQIRAGLS